MSKNAQRLSQLVSSSGPGAMLDLPTRSVIVGGLELWDMRPGSYSILSEERLCRRLEKVLREQGRLSEGVTLQLRTPPVGEATSTGAPPPAVQAPVFPRWFVCDEVEKPGDVKRRMVQWQDLDMAGRRKYSMDNGSNKKSDVTPIRFVCACRKGHLQDINWRGVVHSGTTCREPMWIEEKGTSADPADTTVICNCGQRLSLRDLFIAGRLGKCQGERPWLHDKDPDGCTEDLKLLMRTATNTYFSQVYTVISLPAEYDDLTRLVDQLMPELSAVDTVEKLSMAREFNPRIKAAFATHNDADIFERIIRIRQGAQTDASKSPKLAEFDVFSCGHPQIGQNRADAKLYAETISRDKWDDGSHKLSAIKNLVAVHRLREVSCLYGFTRFEAAPTSMDGDIEDMSLSVYGAPISQSADWLPAMEQFGEGIFLQFDYEALKSWFDSQPVKERAAKLFEGYQHWIKKFSTKPPLFPGMGYIFLHSLSHALMHEIALDCGYPASSLKERLYAVSPTQGVAPDRFGLLIYTASTGAQGTLGGLVATATRIGDLLTSALSRMEICSNDPICADHEPDAHAGDRATHGAACHSCLLIAETSCEARNLFLDRELLVETMSGRRVCFF